MLHQATASDISKEGARTLHPSEAVSTCAPPQLSRSKVLQEAPAASHHPNPHSQQSFEATSHRQRLLPALGQQPLRCPGVLRAVPRSARVHTAPTQGLSGKPTQGRLSSGSQGPPGSSCDTARVRAPSLPPLQTDGPSASLATAAPYSTSFSQGWAGARTWKSVHYSLSDKSGGIKPWPEAQSIRASPGCRGSIKVQAHANQPLNARISRTNQCLSL